MPRLLILCTHNSARSQMAEALARAAAHELGVPLEVWSAGTEASFVKPQAQTVMAESGLPLTGHTSKTLHDVPDPQNFDYVITVCDSADAACPVYPGHTVRRHYPFVDPSGGSLERWRAVRDQLRPRFRAVVEAVQQGQELAPSYAAAPPVTAD